MALELAKEGCNLSLCDIAEEMLNNTGNLVNKTLFFN